MYARMYNTVISSWK